ncbi:MAG: glycosyltransferase, partial [Actinomycetota bacterium]
MPTVLRLITRLNIGGPARQALLLTRNLGPEYETVLAAGTAPPAEGELTDPDIPITRVPLVRAPHPVNDLRAFRAVRGLIRTFKPEIVHSHMAKAGTIGRLASGRADGRPRTVHTFHGHVLQGYFSSPVQRALVAVERRLARRTDALIAVSPEVRDGLLDLGIGAPERFHVIPLGLDLAPFGGIEGRSMRLRGRIGLDAETPLVGVLGRLAPIKDHAMLLEALTHVDGVHLAVMGDGELRPSLEARARELGLGRRVHFTGWWTDVAAAIADVDAVVLSSRNEGTPVSLIEALAGGRPVVATDVGGTR